MQSRFAAGPGSADARLSAVNTAAALDAIRAFVAAWNSHEPAQVAAAIHFPQVRLADGKFEMWPSAEEFLKGSEPGRQRTWFETRIDRTRVVQVSPNGVNVTASISHFDRRGQVLSQDEGLFLVVLRGGAWKVQARSMMGT